MNEKNYFTIVVPLSPDAQKIVQGNPSAVPLRAAVWSQAAERMKPLLGGVCSRFSPAAAPYGEPLHLPFGVALGGAEAEQFPSDPCPASDESTAGDSYRRVRG